MKRSRTRTSKTRRWLEACLLLAGAAGVGIWGWSHVRMAIFQSWENHVLDHRIQSGSRGPSAPQALAPPAIRDGTLIGRLAIPRLNVRSVVREGAGHDTLDVALGHIPGTALPGQPGNAGIAGHRDTLFRGLRNIRKNDLIQFQSPAGSYEYKVESTGIVKPGDVDVLNRTPHPEMTLVTCYPFYYVGAAPDRFIVKARLVNPPTAVQPPPPRRAAALSAHRDPPALDNAAPGPSHVLVRPARLAVVTPGVRPPPHIQKVSFRVNTLHSRELAPGILLRLTWVDPARHRANGWLWLPGEERTIWLWNQPVHQPISFRVPADGPQRQLTITAVNRDSVTGYLR